MAKAASSSMYFQKDSLVEMDPSRLIDLPDGELPAARIVAETDFFLLRNLRALSAKVSGGRGGLRIRGV